MRTFSKVTLFCSVFLLSSFLSSGVFAKGTKGAHIRIGGDHGKIMEIIGDDRVSGRITDLVNSGAGDEEEIVDACFVGKVDEICKILKTAVAEENDKEKYSGKEKLELSSCDEKHGNIYPTVESKKNVLHMTLISPCKND